MQKEVIYIDVEDDITAIIGKVKDAKEKVVAVVPPKRVGVLQSVVNLRLLLRTAEKAHKRLVLITNDQALLGLAAAAKIPVAKNLQSKPELAEVAALSVDGDDDIIDGAQLPVGDHAKTSRKAGASEGKDSVPASVVAGIDIEDDAPAAAPVRPAAARTPRKSLKSGVKVPNFDSFRKKFAIFGALGVLFVGFLVWAIWFAPKATVVIAARTSAVSMKQSVALSDSVETDAKKNTIRAISQQDKKAVEVEFDATGTKDVGEKASGSVVFSNCEDTNSITLNSGTYLSAGGNNYVLQSTIVVPGGNGNFVTGCVTPGVSAPARVIAADIGDEYNLSGGTGFTVEGRSNKFSAQSADGITGGSKKQVKIVTAGDVENAKKKMQDTDAEAMKKTLAGKFSDDVRVIDDSFTATSSDPQSTPAIGAESASGKAKLASEVTYTMSGVTQVDLARYLKGFFEQDIDTSVKRVFDEGADTVKLGGFNKGEQTDIAIVETVGKIGPNIDDDKVKEQVKGMRYGEIQEMLKRIDGVDDADTQFWPMWVRTVPNNVDKIRIEFKLEDGNE